MKTRPIDIVRRRRQSTIARHRPGAWRILFVLWIGLLAGCASVTFKRGASPEAMASDERACRNSTADDAAFVECMRSRGWFMSGTSDRHAEGTKVPVSKPKPGDASDTPNNPIAPPASAEAPLPSIVGNPAAPSPTVPSVAVSTPAVPGNASIPAVVTPTPTVAASSSATMTVSAESVDPMERVSVASWWKLGGTTAGLNRAIDACVAELGDAYRPDPVATEVTVALRGCLRKAGWYPFGSASR
jgi:hypothetical protein